MKTMKLFDVKAAQDRVWTARIEMCGRKYVHYKGGEYIVESVTVDEPTGDIRVAYWSIDRNFYWSRTLDDFTAMVDTYGTQTQRFRRT